MNWSFFLSELLSSFLHFELRFELHSYIVYFIFPKTNYTWPFLEQVAQLLSM